MRSRTRFLTFVKPVPAAPTSPPDRSQLLSLLCPGVDWLHLVRRMLHDFTPHYNHEGATPPTVKELHHPP